MSGVSTPEQLAEKCKRLAMDFAHCYSFVGDDTMPRAKAELEAAIDALAALSHPAVPPSTALGGSDALIEQIAHEWAGCMFDAPGGEIDIADAIIATVRRFLPAHPAAPLRLEACDAAASEPKARIDPMQDPMRPTLCIGDSTDETPAEQVLRKLACWLGVGGYNAPTVDAEVFHAKIVDGINDLVRAPSPAPAPHAGQETTRQDERELPRFTVQCFGCEGFPSGDNNPCEICGRRASTPGAQS